MFLKNVIKVFRKSFCLVLMINCVFISDLSAQTTTFSSNEFDTSSYDSLKRKRIIEKGFDEPEKKYDIRIVPYSYSGNYKAVVYIPRKLKNLPVVIYSYDQFLDLAGRELALKKGYDLEAFLKAFGEWDMICIIPLERNHKLNAVKGAIEYATSLEQANKDDIHMVGVSEGAFLSLLSLDSFPGVKTVTIISPHMIHYTGRLSLPELARKIGKIKADVMLMIGQRENTWKITISEIILSLFQQKGKHVRVKIFDKRKKWFWNPEHEFMSDIYEFITNKPFGAHQLKIDREMREKKWRE
ncbi:hypothetical protein HOG98_02215 [bacterium]|jgi:hypothetical protein|nr:hypothetical protein [bacterium]